VLNIFFELNEDPVYSQPIEIDLQQLLHSLGEITDVTELILTANMPLSEMNRLNWTTIENESSYWNLSGKFVFYISTYCAFFLLLIRATKRHEDHFESDANQNI
jgi:hypothetical protein